MAPLLERLLADRPDLTVLVTSATPTGAEQVEQKFAGRVEWCWAPFDTPGAVKRFLAHWHPTVGDCVRVILEEEWAHLRYVRRDLALLAEDPELGAR